MSDETSQPSLEGTLLSRRYRVGRVLGVGGMGSVYEAADEERNETVAIKVLHPHLALEEESFLRFQREAKAASALGHPHIVQVHRLVTSAGEPPFIVMERLYGMSLSALIRKEKRLEPERVAKVAVQILEALTVAHEANLVHRDIKPANLFVCNRDDRGHEGAKLLDFGVVKLLGDSPDGLRTGAGVLLGTMVYMAPEQARGKTLDARTDLYALGACMYYAIAGRRHIDLKDRPDPLQYMLRAEARPLLEVMPEAPPRLAEIIDRSLRSAKDDRYPSANAMKEAIERWLDGAATLTTKFVPKDREPTAPTTRRDVFGFSRPQRLFLAFVFLVVVVSVAFVSSRI